MKWIPLGKQLPKIGQQVIVARPNKYSGKTDILIAYFHDSGEIGRSCGKIGEDDWLTGYYWSLPAVVKLKTITHWMELPELPEP